MNTLETSNYIQYLNQNGHVKAVPVFLSPDLEKTFINFNPINEPFFLLALFINNTRVFGIGFENQDDVNQLSFLNSDITDIDLIPNHLFFTDNTDVQLSVYNLTISSLVSPPVSEIPHYHPFRYNKPALCITLPNLDRPNLSVSEPDLFGNIVYSNTESSDSYYGNFLNAVQSALNFGDSYSPYQAIFYAIKFHTADIFDLTKIAYQNLGYLSYNVFEKRLYTDLPFRCIDSLVSFPLLPPYEDSQIFILAYPYTNQFSIFYKIDGQNLVQLGENKAIYTSTGFTVNSAIGLFTFNSY